MRKYLLSLVIVITVGLTGCIKPDLIVTTLEKTGVATINAQNSVEVPIRVVVKNKGDADAKIFKTATHYTGSAGKYVVAFTVPGQSNSWYPYSNSPLEPGSEVTHNGKVTFHPSVHGETVSLTATADSCSGDESMPEHCRVKESDEANNESSAISVSLP